MDKNRLGEILSMGDNIVSMQDLVILQRLSEKYPYCSVFKVLCAKFAHILKSFNKEELLALAGVYVSDRHYLKIIIETISLVSMTTETVLNTKSPKDIMTQINSYEDEQLSDNPTRQELLERFLKIENPKTNIGEVSDSEIENVDKAIKQSAKTEFSIVTETMAKIYAKQGDKANAINIYTQLMEKNPDKRMYYANQIEILKNN